MSSLSEPAASLAMGILLPCPLHPLVPCPSTAPPRSPPAFPPQPPRGEPPIRSTSTTCAGGPGKGVQGGEGVISPALPGWKQPAPSPFHVRHGWHWQTDTITQAGASELQLSVPSPLPTSWEGREGWRDKSLDTDRAWKAAPHLTPTCSCQHSVAARIPIQMGKQSALRNSELGRWREQWAVGARLWSARATSGHFATHPVRRD